MRSVNNTNFELWHVPEHVLISANQSLSKIIPPFPSPHPYGLATSISVESSGCVESPSPVATVPHHGPAPRFPRLGLRAWIKLVVHFACPSNSLATQVTPAVGSGPAPRFPQQELRAIS